MKGYIEWTEGNPSRGRKTVLFATIFVYLLITVVLFGGAIYGLEMADIITTLYMTLVSLMVAIYGFYTGTSSTKTTILADKTAEIMIGKLDEAAAAAGAKAKEEEEKSKEKLDEV